MDGFQAFFYCGNRNAQGKGGRHGAKGIWDVVLCRKGQGDLHFLVFKADGEPALERARVDILGANTCVAGQRIGEGLCPLALQVFLQAPAVRGFGVDDVDGVFKKELPFGFVVRLHDAVEVEVVVGEVGEDSEAESAVLDPFKA